MNAKTIVSIVHMHADGTFTQFVPGNSTSVLEPSDLVSEVAAKRKRRRAKRECSICGEKFFAAGLGSHMKMCRMKSPERLNEERQARANLL